jgi:hypothetical protein
MRAVRAACAHDAPPRCEREREKAWASKAPPAGPGRWRTRPTRRAMRMIGEKQRQACAGCSRRCSAVGNRCWQPWTENRRVMQACRQVTESHGRSRRWSRDRTRCSAPRPTAPSPSRSAEWRQHATAPVMPQRLSCHSACHATAPVMPQRLSWPARPAHGELFGLSTASLLGGIGVLLSRQPPVRHPAPAAACMLRRHHLTALRGQRRKEGQRRSQPRRAGRESRRGAGPQARHPERPSSIWGLMHRRSGCGCGRLGCDSDAAGPTGRRA